MTLMLIFGAVAVALTVVAFLSGQVVSSRLYEIQASDPVMLSIAVLIVTASVAVATMIPAFRASRLGLSNVLTLECLMPIVGEEGFGDRPVLRIFLAVNVREARCVEGILDERGINYFVRVEPFGHTLFGSERHGATFFVDASQGDYCERLLIEAGLEVGVLRDVDTCPEDEGGR